MRKIREILRTDEQLEKSLEPVFMIAGLDLEAPWSGRS